MRCENQSGAHIIDYNPLQLIKSVAETNQIPMSHRVFRNDNIQQGQSNQ